MKYDPNNELSDEQLNKLSEDDFFEYLDSKAKYLSQFTKPLGEYHTKRYAVIAAVAEGRELTDKEFKAAKRIGKEGDDINQQRIIDKMNEKNLSEPDKHVKNVKTHRSQWFD
jgi:predicted lactoylglutathione lyase